MLPNPTDTIVALATPPGEGGIAIVRLSGQDCISIADKVIEAGSKHNLSNPRFMILSRLIDSKRQEIDEALTVYFRAPFSYSGDDTFEFHCHGGEYVASRLIDTLIFFGARKAEPGEFTMRAFLNGRIDLTQAEGILALVSSKRNVSHYRAINLLKGGLKERIRSIRDKLLNLIASLEVVIDYTDDDIATSSKQEIEIEIDSLFYETKHLASNYTAGSTYERGFRLAIVGRPNVGKSSIMNCLLMRRRVLVHDSPGTTRDVVSEELILGESHFKIYDTAGIREDANEIEREGILLTHEAMKEADGIICVLDVSNDITKEDFELIEKIKYKPHIICLNKIDLPRKWSCEDYLDLFADRTIAEISARKGEGISELMQKLIELHEKNIDEIKSAIPLLERHYNHLMRALENMQSAKEALNKNLSDDAVLVDLRSALEEILRITGESYDDALLNEIFSNFCVGK